MLEKKGISEKEWVYQAISDKFIQNKGDVMHKVQAGAVTFNRPDFYFITDVNFDRGKEECRVILSDLAKRKKFIGYKELADKLTITYPYDEDPKFTVIAHMVGELSHECHASGLPLISALVVNKTDGSDHQGLPGNGFFELAGWLGEDVSDQMVFWSVQVNRIFNP